MSQVDKTLTQGVADGKELYDFFIGIAQDIALIPLLTDAGTVFTSSSEGTIGISSSHATTPVAGDLLILTTGTSTDTKRAASIVLAASSANTYVVPSAYFSSNTFSTATVHGYLVQFSVLGTAVETTT